MSDWRESAECRGAPINLFYPEGAEISHEALALCERCPVKQECQDYGVVFEDWGIFGGLTATERKKIRNNQGIYTNHRASITNKVRAVKKNEIEKQDAMLRALIIQQDNELKWE
jgi:WhiB family transcriptional regulator, redox-sensing transcriptional regulator